MKGSVCDCNPIHLVVCTQSWLCGWKQINYKLFLPINTLLQEHRREGCNLIGCSVKIVFARIADDIFQSRQLL